MPNNARRAGVKAVGLLSAVALGAGLLTAAAAAPIAGAFGVAARDASKTFNDMTVQNLGFLPQPSRIVNKNGQIIANFYPHTYIPYIYRNPVTYSQISPLMRQAIVAIEDNRFWTRHGAFDLRGTVRALISTASGAQVQGGSTLAQQYVKDALEETATNKAEYVAAGAEDPARKLRELRMAAVVEHQLTKRQLLTAYLNAAPFGHEAYGIQVAANVFFSTTAAKLNLPQAALLAGLVNGPTAFDPTVNPNDARKRRHDVLVAMYQLHWISKQQEQAANAAPFGLRLAQAPAKYSGCYNARVAPFFCQYVLDVMQHDPAFRQAWYQLNNVGGMTIRTTLDPRDQRAAQSAVNYIVPYRSATFNPGQNADTEVLIQPGTGKVRAIAEDRPFGLGTSATGPTTIDYAANSAYGGQAGVQTGSSAKIFTLLTALSQNYAFGFHLKVKTGMTVGPFTSCTGQYINPFQVNNAEPGSGNYSLYTGTTASINAFYVSLEQRVGLCNVVKMAARLGVTKADGRSLLRWGDGQPPADQLASFTLGSVYVSPMSMAGAYATLAARGRYCRPVLITSIASHTGQALPVESANCRQVVPRAWADAANYILQGVLTSGTAVGRSINRPAAAKTGTANGGYYAAFGGFTPTLAAYVSVFNPAAPTGYGAMLYPTRDCYRDLGGALTCPGGQMFGANAPGATWQTTFLHANLGPPVSFVGVPTNSLFFRNGTGIIAPNPPKPKKPKGPSGSPTPSPTPSH